MRTPRLLGLVLIATLALLCPAPVLAWDGVTHGHITDLAIEKVQTPALRAFLREHRDAVQSGGAFPDWGHGLKPHGDTLHALYLDAAWADLQRPERQEEPGYPILLAHYLGAYAHVVQDRVLDATLKKHAASVGEADRDDMENAMVGIAGGGMLGWRYDPFVPDAHFARIYAQSDYFGEPRLNEGNLKSLMHDTMARGAALERSLKLLSFLSLDYSRRAWPWGAANLADAPGGYESNAAAVAAGWEALWAERHGRAAPFFVFTLPGNGETLPSIGGNAGYSRITVVTAHRFDVRGLSREMIKLIGPDGPVPVRVWPYIDIPGHDVDLAFQIEALTPWVPGADYRLEIAPGSEAPADLVRATPLHIAFSTPTTETYTTRLTPPPRRFAMGLFLFAIVGGTACVLFGTPDLLATAMRLRATPKAFRVVDLGVKSVAVLIFGAGLWLLVTDGTAFIDFLRERH